jgi:hypothetical protein
MNPVSSNAPLLIPALPEEKVREGNNFETTNRRDTESRSTNARFSKVSPKPQQGIRREMKEMVI